MGARISATRARIVRDELRDVPAAATAFERALDLDPRDAAGAFGELCAMWAEAGRDAMLATCYRRQISRLADDPARRRALCDELGSLCRDEIGDLAGAWEAYADARDLDPHNPTRDAILADLSERLGKREEALALHHALSAEPPAPLTSLRALRRLYRAAGDAVAAGWMAAALVVHDEADVEDLAAFALTRDTVRAPQGLLSEHDWLEPVAHHELSTIQGSGVKAHQKLRRPRLGHRRLAQLERRVGLRHQHPPGLHLGDHGPTPRGSAAARTRPRAAPSHSRAG